MLFRGKYPSGQREKSAPQNRLRGEVNSAPGGGETAQFEQFRRRVNGGVGTVFIYLTKCICSFDPFKGGRRIWGCMVSRFLTDFVKFG